jgi:hypothetical protein
VIGAGVASVLVAAIAIHSVAVSLVAPAPDRVPASTSVAGETAPKPALRTGATAGPSPSSAPAAAASNDRPSTAASSDPRAQGVAAVDSTPRAAISPPAGENLRVHSIADEVALLDRARAASATGDAAEALRLLDAYEAQFKAPTFELEARVLRIDALDAVGRSGLALNEGERFLAAHPNEPMSRHVRSLLDRIRARKDNP